MREEKEAKQHFVRNLAVKAFPHGKPFVKHFARHSVKHFVKVIKGLGDQPSGKPVRVIMWTCMPPPGHPKCHGAPHLP